jgi:hypothetical protein
LLSLGLGNPSTASRTHLPPLVFCRFRLDCGFSGVTAQNRTELGCVGVDVAFLFLETENSGANDFGVSFGGMSSGFSDLRFPQYPFLLSFRQFSSHHGRMGDVPTARKTTPAVPSALAKNDQGARET